LREITENYSLYESTNLLLSFWEEREMDRIFKAQDEQLIFAAVVGAGLE